MHPKSVESSNRKRRNSQSIDPVQLGVRVPPNCRDQVRCLTHPVQHRPERAGRSRRCNPSRVPMHRRQWLRAGAQEYQRSFKRSLASPTRAWPPPYSINWSEQADWMKHLPTRLQRMVLFVLGCGARDDNVCMLKWAWDRKVPRLDRSVLMVSRTSRRCPYRPVHTMNNSAFLCARRTARLDRARGHDLRHAFGQRLRDAGVAEEDRHCSWATPSMACPSTTSPPRSRVSWRRSTRCRRCATGPPCRGW